MRVNEVEEFMIMNNREIFGGEDGYYANDTG